MGLVIEIDGSSHDNKVEYDKARQDYLEALGLRVYRIGDWEVKKDIGMVMRDLEGYILREYGEDEGEEMGWGGEGTTPSCGHPSKGGGFSK